MSLLSIEMKNVRKDNIKKSIFSKKGASIVLALYFLLICCVLSALIILAGTVSAGSLTNNIELKESENITLSCFKKISDEISYKTFNFATNDSESYFEQSIRSDGVILLSSFISDAFVEVSKNGEYEKDYEIKIDNMATKICGTFSMNENYEIKISVDEIIKNNDTKLMAKKRVLKFYPLSVKNENQTITVKMGEAQII